MGIFSKKGAKEESYTPEFLELERRKRYGYANKIEETKEAYKIRMYFPSIVPPSNLTERLGLPREMPDYEYDIELEKDTLIVKARLTDEKVLKLTGVVNSFPDRFYRDFALSKPVTHFESSYSNKMLDITIFKSKETASEEF